MNIYKFIFTLLLTISMAINCMDDRRTLPAKSAQTSQNLTITPLQASDINPQIFGLNQAGEKYVSGLRDLAQIIYLHDQFMNETKAFENIFIKQNQLSTFHRMDQFGRMSLLDQRPDATYMTQEREDYFEKIDEIKKALKGNQQHDNIITTPEGIRLFAASPEGITFLLMHKSLFTQPLNKNHKNLIDELCKSSKNFEVIILALHLKTKIDQTLINSNFEEQKQKWVVAFQKLQKSIQLIRDNHQQPSARLTTVLQILTNHADCHFQKIHQRLQLGFTMEHYSQRITMMQAETAYKDLQLPKTYELLARPLKSLIAKFGKKNPHWKNFSNTVFGENLPLALPAEKTQQPLAAQTPQSKPTSSVTEAQKKVEENKSIEKDIIVETKTNTRAEIIESKPTAVIQADQPIEQEKPLEQKSIEKPAEQPFGKPTVEPRPVAAKTPEIPTPAKKSELVLLEQYEDGVIVEQVANQIVTIDDIANNMRLCLYPTENTCQRIQLKKPMFKNNVTIWFQDVNKALEGQGYLDRNNKKFCSDSDRKTEVIRIHRFSKHVDKFISSMGVKYSTQSRISADGRDNCIVIPGHIELLESGEKKTCYFVYLIDEKNKCFHRNIEFKKPTQIYSDFLSKGFFEAEFPPLGWNPK